MQVVVDRIENNIVVLEVDGKIVNVNIDKVEGEICEGDVVDIEYLDDEIVKVKVNKDKTKSRQEYMSDLIKGMWQ